MQGNVFIAPIVKLMPADVYVCKKKIFIAGCYAEIPMIQPHSVERKSICCKSLDCIRYLLHKDSAVNIFLF